MRKFGAHEGAAVYKAIDDAADRNVSIRCGEECVTHFGLCFDTTACLRIIYEQTLKLNCFSEKVMSVHFNLR